MKYLPRLLVCGCLSTLATMATADDIIPPPPAVTPPVPSFTYPAPMQSSSGNGVIVHDGAAPPIVHGNGAPAPRASSEGIIESRSSSATLQTAPLGSLRMERRAFRSNRQTIDQFQSSSYWQPPQPFHAWAAPDYGYGLAGGGGIHIRYPYYKYRAPWTYQGPHGISHTIEW